MVRPAIAIVNLPPRKMMGIDSEGMLISAVHEEDGHEGLNLLMVDDRYSGRCKALLRNRLRREFIHLRMSFLTIIMLI